MKKWLHTGRGGVGWGNGTFSADFHPPRTDFKNAVKKQNEKKKVFNEEFIKVQIYSVCIHVPLKGRFICS